MTHALHTQYKVKGIKNTQRCASSGGYRKLAEMVQRKFELIAVQGHPRSSTLVSIERTNEASY